MFKDVISRDNGEPWPPTGMTSALWLLQPLIHVRISQLVATQPGVYFLGLRQDCEHLGADHPHVIHWDGNLYLEDGHHRALKTLLRGESGMLARYLSL